MKNPFKSSKYEPHVIGELNRLTRHHDEKVRWGSCDALLTHTRHERDRVVKVILALLWQCVFLIIALLAFGCSSVRHLPTAPRLLASQVDTAIRLEVTCENHQTDLGLPDRYGSGVIIDSRHVLTAFHVTTCPLIPRVIGVTSAGERLRMVVDREWADRDVTRLELASADTFGNIHPPVFAKASFDHAYCLTASFPVRGGACGAIDTMRKMACEERTPGHRWCGDLELSIFVLGGNSGAPLYDDDGALVGIITAGRFFTTEEGEATNIPSGSGRASSLADIARDVMR